MTLRVSLKYRFFKPLAGVLTVFFALNSVLPPALAQGISSVPSQPALVLPSAAFRPASIKGIKVYPADPFRFDFLIDRGEVQRDEAALKKESEKLIKYFLAALTVPEKDLWVNLSPYERDRIIPDPFSATEMGQEMLAQDYILKQLTASLIYPEGAWGKRFWAKVYDQAQALYETTEIPVNTFHKVWIVPEQAEIYVHGQNVFIVHSHLKVMLERDYLAQKSAGIVPEMTNPDGKENDISSEILREIVIPELEKEVNQGEHFAPLRQIYHSLILAIWYKRNLRDSILSRSYTDRNKTVGVQGVDESAKEKIYQSYLDTYRNGIYNYIREEYDPVTQQPMPRKYFSGGTNFSAVKIVESALPDPAIIAEDPSLLMVASADLVPAEPDGAPVRINGNGADSTPGGHSPIDNDPLAIILQRLQQSPLDFIDDIPEFLNQFYFYISSADRDQQIRPTQTALSQALRRKAVEDPDAEYSIIYQALAEEMDKILSRLWLESNANRNSIDQVFVSSREAEQAAALPEEIDLVVLGERIKELRTRGEKDEKLFKKLGIKGVNRAGEEIGIGVVLFLIEKGRAKVIGLPTLMKIANYYRVSIFYLLTGIKDERPFVPYQWNAQDIQFNKNLAQARKERKLSQAEVARRVGVDQSHVGYIEVGRIMFPDLHLFVRLLKALQIPPDRLLRRNIALQAIRSRIPLSKQWIYLTDDVDRKAIGLRVKSLREANKLTQKEVGQQLELDQTDISDAEIGRVNLHVLLKLANYFHVTLFFLLTGQESELPWQEYGFADFIANVKSLRSDLGLNSVQLSKKMGRSRTYIMDMESGNRFVPRLDSILSLARVLKVPVDILLGPSAGVREYLKAKNAWHNEPEWKVAEEDFRYIGDLVQNLRLERGQSLEDVVFETGISLANLTKIENGLDVHVSLVTFLKLANHFQIPLVRLLTGQVKDDEVFVPYSIEWSEAYVGRNMIKLIELSGASNGALEELLKINRKTIADMRKGERITVNNFIRLMKGFGVSSEHLLKPVLPDFDQAAIFNKLGRLYEDGKISDLEYDFAELWLIDGVPFEEIPAALHVSTEEAAESQRSLEAVLAEHKIFFMPGAVILGSGDDAALLVDISLEKQISTIVAQVDSYLISYPDLAENEMARAAQKMTHRFHFIPALSNAGNSLFETKLARALRKRARQQKTRQEQLLMHLADSIDTIAQTYRIDAEVNSGPFKPLDFVAMGKRFEIFRKSKGLSKERAAKLIGIAKATLQEFESASRMQELEVLLKLANFQEMTLYTFLTGQPDNVPFTPYNFSAIRANFGYHVQMVRHIKDIGLNQLADVVEDSKQHLNDTEKKSRIPDFPLFWRIVQALDVPLEWFLRDALPYLHLEPAAPTVEEFVQASKLSYLMDGRGMGLRVRKLRNEKNMSQKEFSQAIGITQRSLWEIESGKSNIHLETAIAIADYCQIPLFFLVTGYESAQYRPFSPYEFSPERVSSNIKTARGMLGMTQGQLKARTGLSVTYIGKIENGKDTPKLHAFIALAKALDIPPDLLVGSTQKLREYIEQLLAPVAEEDQWKFLQADLEYVGRAIKIQRERKKRTLEWVAENLRITPGTLTKIEKGREPFVSVSTIFQLANILDVSLFSLLTGRESVKKISYDPQKTPSHVRANLLQMKNDLDVSLRELSREWAIPERTLQNIIGTETPAGLLSMITISRKTRVSLDNLSKPRYPDYVIAGLEAALSELFLAEVLHGIEYDLMEEWLVGGIHQNEVLEEARNNGYGPGWDFDALWASAIDKLLKAGILVKEGNEIVLSPKWIESLKREEKEESEAQDPALLVRKEAEREAVWIERAIMDFIQSYPEEARQKPGKAAKKVLSAFYSAPRWLADSDPQQIIETILSQHLRLTKSKYEPEVAALMEEIADQLDQAAMRSVQGLEKTVSGKLWWDHFKWPEAGERLRIIRESKNKNLAEAAREIGLTRHTLRRIEQGVQMDVQLDTMLKIANYYQVSLHTLLTGEIANEPVAPYDLNVLKERQVGRNIKRERLAQNFTQNQLADSAGIKRSYLMNVENGAKGISFFYLLAVAKSFKISPDRLLRFPLHLDNRIPLVDETLAWWQLPEKINVEEIARRIRILRGMRKESQPETAQLSGVKFDTLSYIEKARGNDVDLEDLLKLANHFEVSLIFLLTGMENRAGFLPYDIDNLKNNLGENLNTAYRTLGWIMEGKYGLPDLSGVSRSNIFRLRRKDYIPKVSTFVSLVRTLRVSPEQILAAPDQFTQYLLNLTQPVPRKEEWKWMYSDAGYIGSWIRYERERRRETLEQSSAGLKIPVNQLMAIEAGQPDALSVKTLVTIAESWDLSLFTLITGRVTEKEEILRSSARLPNYLYINLSRMIKQQEIRSPAGLRDISPAILESIANNRDIPASAYIALAKSLHLAPTELLRSVDFGLAETKDALSMETEEPETDHDIDELFSRGVISDLEYHFLDLFWSVEDGRPLKLYAIAERLELSTKELRSLIRSLTEKGIIAGEEMIKRITGHGNGLTEWLKSGAGVPAPRNDQKNSDPAALVKPEEVGGIDFVPDNLNLTVHGSADLEINVGDPNADFHFEGLTPVIFQMTPVTNLPLLLGIGENDPPSQVLSKISS